MPQEYPKALKTARQAVLLTLEQASEAADVSLQSYKAYEYGGRLPPNDVAVRLCEALEAPWLALVYLREASEELGVLPQEIKVQSLPTAVITLINRVFAFADHHRDRQLLAIAEDGVIDEEERPAFEDIVEDLDGIIGAALAVKYPRTETKKDRPDGGTSKRSVFRTCVENDSKIIISHPIRNASPSFARGGGASR